MSKSVGTGKEETQQNKSDTHKKEVGTYTSFTSEAGTIDFFLFASARSTGKDSNRAQRVQKLLSEVTGVAELPPRHTLGYHFSKYAPVSADIFMERSQNFTDNKYPVDVLWSDLQWSQQYDEPDDQYYFKFNPKNFTEPKLEQMYKKLEDEGRHLTVIIDPHIK